MEWNSPFCFSMKIAPTSVKIVCMIPFVDLSLEDIQVGLATYGLLACLLGNIIDIYMDGVEEKHIILTHFSDTVDIESIIIVHDEVIFPGTYSGNQEWKTKTPKHGHATIELSKFQKHENGTDFVLWCNTWNHLLGESNTNTTEAINYCQAKPCGSIETKDSIDYVVRKGSRAEVDARFKGLMTSVSTVMTEDTAKKLGKRIF